MKKTVGLLLAISLMLNGWLVWERNGKFNADAQDTERADADRFAFLSKRIFTQNQNDVLINFVPLRLALREYVGRFDGNAGVYFEYLPSGVSVGVNDQMEVRLASLIKVPIVMAVYKQIEGGSMVENQTLTVSSEDLSAGFGDLWKRGTGVQVTLMEAVRMSLVDSDNTAARILRVALPDGEVEKVFDSLDIFVNQLGQVPFVTPKGYSSILRSLYLSSYLARESSNEILELLTRTKFSDLLPAGVDDKVKVAHKIGVFESDGVWSDCGIVYVPDRPYILCVMSRASKNEAGDIIREVSRMVYAYVSQIEGGSRR